MTRTIEFWGLFHGALGLVGFFVCGFFGCGGGDVVFYPYSSHGSLM